MNTTKTTSKRFLIQALMVALGTAIYAYGFVNLNMVNHLAEGGISGVTLIGNALFNVDPAYLQILFNIPLFILGYKVLGKGGLAWTVYGTLTMSFWIWLFQRLPHFIDVHHDLLIAAVLAGIFAGIGTGIVFRFGGTTGGTDIIAKVLEVKFGIQLSHTLFAIDVIVLLASLTYIDLNNMMYTLIASFVFSNVVNVVQNGGYAVRGMLIITEKPDEVANRIMDVTMRGATFLNGKGAYSNADKKIVYVVLTPQEVITVKALMADLDPRAFISIINVHEVVGEGFTFDADVVESNKEFM